jgi:hypothetical protein
MAAFLWMGFSPLLWVLMALGPKWRKEIKAREEEKRKKKAASAAVVATETASDVPSTPPVIEDKETGKTPEEDYPRTGEETDTTEIQAQSKETKARD